VSEVDLDAADQALARPRPMEAGDARTGRTLRTVYIASAAAVAGNQLFTLLLFYLLLPYQVGLINWGTATAALIFYLLEGGVETAVVIVAKQRAVSLRAMVWVVGGFRLMAAVIALAAWTIAVALRWIPSLEASALLIIGVGSVVRLFQTPFSAALQVRDRQATVAVLGLVPVAIRLSLLGTLWAIGGLRIASVLIASLVGDVGALFAMFMAVRGLEGEGFEGISLKDLTRSVARAAPLLTASQAILIAQSRMDWVLVATFASYAALANYAIANKAVELLVLGGGLFGRTALPWFVAGWERRNLMLTVRWLIAIVTVASILLAVLGWPAVHLVFKDKYEGSGPIIPFLAVLGPPLVMFQVVQFSLLARKHTFDVVVAGGAAVLIQLLVDVIAIPPLGILGAALGMWAFAAVSFPLVVYFAWRRVTITSRAAAEIAIGGTLLPLAYLLAVGLSRL
jgi:PST family polysaccharide transporter